MLIFDIVTYNTLKSYITTVVVNLLNEVLKKGERDYMLNKIFMWKVRGVPEPILQPVPSTRRKNRNHTAHWPSG